jgi:vacuolar-type H+-ATPase subunit H
VRLSFRPALSVTSLIVAACSRTPSPSVDAQRCQPGCARVVKLKMVGDKRDMAINVHEADEAVEAAEDHAARETKRIHEELAAGDPTWDAKVISTLPRKVREARTAQHEYDLKQLTAQREEALRTTKEIVESKKKAADKIKADAAAWESKTTADLTAACVTSCSPRPASFAECLSHIQALEDVAICEKR